MMAKALKLSDVPDNGLHYSNISCSLPARFKPPHRHIGCFLLIWSGIPPFATELPQLATKHVFEGLVRGY